MLTIWRCWLAFSLFSFCLVAQQAESERIRQIDRDLQRSPDVERTRLLVERENALFRLMKSSPAEARSFFPAESRRRIEGSAVAIVEDYFDQHKSVSKWRLDTGSGYKDVFFDSPPPPLT